MGKLKKKFYEQELENLQIELVKLQEWVKHKKLKVVVIFEGRDAAGKGGVIKRITEKLNPRVCRIAALPAPTEKEKTQWYFQRYVAHLPAGGEIVLFDRSWYNRAGVEKVMGFCNDEEYEEFLRSCPEFERMLQRSGIILLKYWFSVSDEEQEKRFIERKMKCLRIPIRNIARGGSFPQMKNAELALTALVIYSAVLTIRMWCTHPSHYRSLIKRATSVLLLMNKPLSLLNTD